MRLLPALLLLLPACGSLPDLARTRVDWTVTPSEVTCSNRDTPIAIDVFPSGWSCHWRCGLYEGGFAQVWLDVDVRDGEFASDPPVYVSRCYDEEATCPTCNFE